MSHSEILTQISDFLSKRIGDDLTNLQVQEASCLKEYPDFLKAFDPHNFTGEIEILLKQCMEATSMDKEKLEQEFKISSLKRIFDNIEKLMRNTLRAKGVFRNISDKCGDSDYHKVVVETFCSHYGLQKIEPHLHLLRKFALQSKAVTRDNCSQKITEVEKALQRDVVDTFRNLKLGSKSRVKSESTDEDFESIIEPGKLMIDSDEATIEITIKRKRKSSM